MSMQSINTTHAKAPFKTLTKNILLGCYAILLLSACQSNTPLKDSLKPVSPQAQAAYQQAVSVMRSGQTQHAFKLFNSITKKYPGFAGPQLNIGLMYLKKNQLGMAEKAFKNAIHINRDNAVGYNLLGVVYRKSGKFLQAKESYHQALSKNADYANAHLNLGILYDIYMDNLKQAVHHYEQYQRLSNDNDKKVAKWIIDLKRRIKTDKTSAQLSRSQPV